MKCGQGSEHSTSWYAGETMSSLCLHKFSQCCGAMRVKSRPDSGRWDPSPQEYFGHVYAIEALYAEDATLNLEEISVSQPAQMHAFRGSSYFQEALLIILTPLTRNSCRLFHQLDPTGNRGDVDRQDGTRSVQKTPAISSTVKVSTLVLEEKARASMVSSVVEFILRWESRIEY
jgi:hypothetical protein